MTFLRPLPGSSTGGVATPALQGLIFAVMEPAGWDPAVDTVGHNMIPMGAPRLSTARAAAGTLSFNAYVLTGAMSVREIAVRHRVAGASVNNAVYTVWRNSSPIATFEATVALASTTEVVDLHPSPPALWVAGDRIEVVVQLSGVTPSGADMPQDVVVYIG